jgi:predicted phosphodiesterase
MTGSEAFIRVHPRFQFGIWDLGFGNGTTTAQRHKEEFLVPWCLGGKFSVLIWLLGSVLLFCSCKWDLSQAFLRPPVERRVQECLSGSIAVPQPVAVNPDSFRFAVLTDLHFGDADTADLSWFRSEAMKLGVGFICVLGDITHDGLAAEYAQGRARLDALDIPYYATIGNHDLYQNDGWEQFKTKFGPSCYSVVVADRLRLVFLDTADGLLGPAQFEWLAAQLQDDRYIKVVGTHYPCYDGITPIMWRLASATERYKLQHLLEQYGVRAYAAGHIHGWRHARIGGVDHFIAGSMAPGKLDYGTRGFLLFTYAHDSLSWSQVKP